VDNCDPFLSVHVYLSSDYPFGTTFVSLRPYFI